jgi:polyisoprenoid-binding protein YceI
MMSRRLKPAFATWFFAALLACLSASAGDVSAQDFTVQLDPARTNIAFTLGDVLHTVHGTFQLKSGTIHFNPGTGAASGLVVVDVTSGDSGNKSRDRKMHKDILESAKYPDATFTPNKVSGQFNPQGASTLEVGGIFRLHGSDHPVTLTFPVQVQGSTINMTTHMVIPYVRWGLKNPSTFILRVSDKLDLDVKATGQLTATGTQASAAKP